MDDMSGFELRAKCSLAHMGGAGDCPNDAVCTANLSHASECCGENDLTHVLLCRDCLVAHRRMAENLPGPCPFCHSPVHRAVDWIDDVRYLSAML